MSAKAWPQAIKRLGDRVRQFRRHAQDCQFPDLQVTHHDHGDGEPVTRSGWAHHRCLNAALHPRHLIRVYKNDEPIDPDELDRLLESPPTAEE